MSECPECKKTSLRGRPQLVEEIEKEGPLLRITDDKGYHFHDTTIIVRYMQCSNGHDWVERTKLGCSHCEILDQTTIIVPVDDVRQDSGGQPQR